VVVVVVVLAVVAVVEVVALVVPVGAVVVAVAPVGRVCTCKWSVAGCYFAHASECSFARGTGPAARFVLATGQPAGSPTGGGAPLEMTHTREAGQAQRVQL